MEKTLLIVDDCEMIRRFLKGYLSQFYTVLEKPNALDALEYLKSNPAPAVILLDYDLPGMSGYDLLRYVRLQHKFDSSVILMLSGMKDAEKRLNCLETGAQDFLAKPFFPKELKLRIDRARQTPLGFVQSGF